MIQTLSLPTRRALIGRAERTLVSADVLGHWMPRLERTWAKLE